MRTEKQLVKNAFKRQREEMRIQIVKDTIRHWEDMVDWAERQDADEKTCMDFMFDAMGSKWSSSCCPFCQAYGSPGSGMGFIRCAKCPLDNFPKSLGCRDGSPWDKVNDARTWGDWAAAARRHMLPALRKALKREMREPDSKTGRGRKQK